MSGGGNGESHVSLASSLVIRSKNKMEGKFIVYGIKDDDLPSTLNPRVETYDDLRSFLNIPYYYSSDLESLIRIPSYNKMEAVYDLEEPPVVTVELTPIKDTFIRSYMPKVNFGSQGDLLVGSSSQGEIYRSLLQFDISSIPKNKVIKEAKLVLHLFTVTKKGDIQVSPILSPWTEYGTTWENQPSSGNPVSTSSNTDISGIVTIDTTSLVTDWYTGKIDNNGLYLKAVDELAKYYSLYHSREGAQPPKLVIKYYDPTIYSVGRSNLPSEAFIVAVDNSDLESQVEIKALWHDNDLESSVYINIPDTLPGTIIVSKPELPSLITVTVNDYADLESELTVRVADGSSDLESFVSVRGTYKEDLPSSVTVKYPDQFDLGSDIIVHHASSLSSSVSVRGVKNSDLDSSVIIHVKDDLEGEFIVHQKNDLDGDLHVRGLGEYDLFSEVDVYQKSDLEGFLFVTSDQLRSELVVRSDGFNDIESNLVVLFANESNLSSDIVVRGKDDKDLPSEIKVRVHAYKDLPSELVPRLLGVSDIESSIEVEISAKELYPYAYIM